MVSGSYWNNYFGSQGSDANYKIWWERMASILVYLLLPVAGLIMFWLKKELVTKILIHIDAFYLPVTCPVFGRTRSTVDWARTRLPKQWSSHMNTLSGGLADFWKDGSLLCTLINSAIPGACPNPYRHWNKPLIHGQDIAYKYLGIVPVFTESDFSCQLSPYFETKLLNYLIRVRKSIHALEKEKTIYPTISPKFVARGMGLYAAEQFQESEFFVYSKYDHVSFYNIEIIILGPYSTYCRTTVLEYLVRESRSKENAVSTTESVTIRIELEKDRAKVAYTAKNCGIHEIILSCNKESIMGSPFYVNVMKSYNNLNGDSERANETITGDFNDDLNEMDTKSTENISTAAKTDVKNHIANSQTMEISKYLKDLSNSQEKKVNKPKNIFDKIWGNCPDYFTRENYAYFQKLVDSSFRKACRITRAHPKFRQRAFPQFYYASPICSKHIDREDFGKLGVDEKRKIFSMRKSSAIDKNCNLPKGSSLSINESREEAGNNSKSIEQSDESTNEKYLKRLNGGTKKRCLQKTVQEKTLFWESVFNDCKMISNLDEPRESDNAEKRNLFRPAETQRKCQLTKSLSDKHRSDKIKKIKNYRSMDCNLDMCCEISLENRAKLYLERTQSSCGNFLDDGAEMCVSNDYDRSIFRNDVSKGNENLDKVELNSLSNSVDPLVIVETNNNSVEINISLAGGIEKSDTIARDINVRKKKIEDNSKHKKCNSVFPIKKERRSVMNFSDVLY